MNKIVTIDDTTICTQIVDILNRFDEPQRYQPNRYDNWIENTSALTEALKAFYNDSKLTQKEFEKKKLEYSELPLNELFIIVELQYNELSSTEAFDFQDAINILFESEGKWRMENGKIIKAPPKAMNKISEVTRQEIIDLTNIGFRDSGSLEDVRIFWWGRLSEPDFLSRLYDLTNMRSTDGRFSNAYQDIWQHRENNTDWDNDWVFYDERFMLKAGDDEKLLRFLCEMFHPAVRDEKKNWKRLLELINNLLQIDGYELYEKTHISGRSLYGWRNINSKNVVVQSQAENLKQSFNSDYIRAQIEAMNVAIDINPYDAIGKSKELLETCCKTILKSKGVSVNKNWDVIKLTKETCGILKLTPDDIDDTAKASDIIKRLLGNLSVISQSMAELRNSYGSGHGKDAKFKGLTPRHARLAVGAGVTAIHFLWETFEEKYSDDD